MTWNRGDWLGLVLVLLCTWTLWCSLAAKAQDRIAMLKPVEAYAMAVYDQLVWNYAFTGTWRQTIHFGYDDTWNWSGHLALWIFPVSWIYRLYPGPVTLVWVQTAAVALGAVPMYFLGRRVFGYRPAGVVAALAYLCWPALWAVALADYQDLVLGIPFLVAAYAASQAGRRVAVVVFALLACGAREEWLFLVPFIPLAAPGGLPEKVRQGLYVAAGLVPYAAFLADVRLQASAMHHHDTPLVQQLEMFLRWPPPFTRTYSDVRWFYAHFLEPFGWLAVFSPATLLPTALSVFTHACSPPEGGVDTRWLGHIHHLAPISAMLAVGATLGAGQVWRWGEAAWGRLPFGARLTARQGALRVGAAVLLGAVIAASSWGAQDSRRLLPWLKLTPQLTPFGNATPAPEWALLAANVPKDATIATDTYGSILVSARATSYTYDESLADKSRAGLGAVKYALVRKQDVEWLGRVKARPGAKKLGETATYELYELG